MSAEIQSAVFDIALWLYLTSFVPGDRLLAKFPELDVAGHGPCRVRVDIRHGKVVSVDGVAHVCEQC